MTPLLELERGDLSDLEGRVIIYATCPSPPDSPDAPDSPQVPDSEDAPDSPDAPVADEPPQDPDEIELTGPTVAMFFSTHPSDFVDRFGVPEGGLEDLARQEAEAREDMDQGTFAMVPIYGAPVDLDDTDLSLAPEDVVYAGSHSHPQMCLAAVQIAAQLYVLRYSEQLIARSGLLEQLQPKKEEEPQEPPPNYHTIPRDQMGDYLQKTFIAPIMLALEEDDQDGAMNIVRDFTRFCGPRGPLTDDAYALAAAVRSFSNEKRVPILYKYFEKILAIANEQFEDAARLRDEISAMKKDS